MMNKGLGALTLLMALSAAPSFALDKKWFSGYECKPGQFATRGAAPYYSVGAAWNKSWQTLRLSCPMVRDAGNIKFFTLWYIDNNPNEDMTCYVGDRNIGSDGRFHTFTKTLKSAPGMSPLIKQVSMYFGDPEETENTVYYLDCYVPPAWDGQASAVVSYYLEEWN